MTNIIHAENRFSDESVKRSVEYSMWFYLRFMLGRTYDEALPFKATWTDVERLERLYTDWLVKRGDEVYDRR